MPAPVISKFYTNERTSGIYTATMLDDSGAAVPSATLQTLELWLFEKTQKDIINSRGIIDGAGQNVLTPGSHGVTIHATSGLLTWVVSTLDTTCVLTFPPETPRAAETHVAVFKGSWSSGLRGFTIQFEIIITDMIPEVNL